MGRRKWTSHDGGQRHGGETLIENAGFTCGEHDGSPILRGRKKSG